ncbi:unnamed protein product [Amoebophrya sp. A25]|nr:unnamed protein product [Amoebophrya sp. A25]|eukprot:GSA25T00008861001.1
MLGGGRTRLGGYSSSSTGVLLQHSSTISSSTVVDGDDSIASPLTADFCQPVPHHLGGTHDSDDPLASLDDILREVHERRGGGGTSDPEATASSAEASKNMNTQGEESSTVVSVNPNEKRGETPPSLSSSGTSTVLEQEQDKSESEKRQGFSDGTTTEHERMDKDKEPQAQQQHQLHQNKKSAVPSAVLPFEPPARRTRSQSDVDDDWSTIPGEDSPGTSCRIGVGFGDTGGSSTRLLDVSEDSAARLAQHVTRSSVKTGKATSLRPEGERLLFSSSGKGVAVEHQGGASSTSTSMLITDEQGKDSQRRRPPALDDAAQHAFTDKADVHAAAAQRDSERDSELVADRASATASSDVARAATPDEANNNPQLSPASERLQQRVHSELTKMNTASDGLNRSRILQKQSQKALDSLSADWAVQRIYLLSSCAEENVLAAEDYYSKENELEKSKARTQLLSEKYGILQKRLADRESRLRAAVGYSSSSSGVEDSSVVRDGRERSCTSSRAQDPSTSPEPAQRQHATRELSSGQHIAVAGVRQRDGVVPQLQRKVSRMKQAIQAIDESLATEVLLSSRLQRELKAMTNTTSARQNRKLTLAIQRARPFFLAYRKFCRSWKEIRQELQEEEKRAEDHKMAYSAAITSLERISHEEHVKRGDA